MDNAFEEEALWNKSKAYIDKALAARDEGDDSGFHLWAAVALELLGKAALAHVHPALVADPSDIKSLLAACGVQTTPKLKSITAKTVFERLRTTCQNFDRAMADECMKMMNRRNAELHSGQSPILGLDPRAWVPVLWKNVDVLLEAQGKNLEDWLGGAEAERVQAILSDSAETSRQAVLGRIERRKSEFEARSPKGSQQRQDAERRAESRPAPFAQIETAYDRVACPSCGLPAWLRGEEWNREVIDTVIDPDEDNAFGGYYEVVDVTYGSEVFHCEECNLTLEGQDEIEVSGLPATFEQEMEEEPDYEPEFGND